MDGGGNTRGILRIGPIEARIDAAEVAAFARAAAIDGTVDDAAAGAAVPATFPAVWLWHPRARAAVADMAADGRAPVLTAQRFDYHAALRVGAAYTFEIERRSEASDPDAFTIEARVHDASGETAATFTAAYRLFAAA